MTELKIDTSCTVLCKYTIWYQITGTHTWFIGSSFKPTKHKTPWKQYIGINNMPNLVKVLTFSHVIEQYIISILKF